MSTKNLLDNPRQRPTVFSDLTGKVSYDPRLDIAETLIFLHEVYDLMKVAAEPEVHPLAPHRVTAESRARERSPTAEAAASNPAQ